MSKKADRNNQSKVQLSRIPQAAALEEAKVWMYGELKYPREDPNGPANWRALWGDETFTVAMDSALRHLAEMTEGRMFDKETGLPNAAHVRCNMAFIIQYMADKGMINPHVYNANCPPPKKTKVLEDSADKDINEDVPTHCIGGCI